MPLFSIGITKFSPETRAIANSTLSVQTIVLALRRKIYTGCTGNCLSVVIALTSLGTQVTILALSSLNPHLTHKGNLSSVIIGKVHRCCVRCHVRRIFAACTQVTDLASSIAESSFDAHAVVLVFHRLNFTGHTGHSFCAAIAESSLCAQGIV